MTGPLTLRMCPFLCRLPSGPQELDVEVRSHLCPPFLHLPFSECQEPAHRPPAPHSTRSRGHPGRGVEVGLPGDSPHPCALLGSTLLSCEVPRPLSHTHPCPLLGPPLRPLCPLPGPTTPSNQSSLLPGQCPQFWGLQPPPAFSRPGAAGCRSDLPSNSASRNLHFSEGEKCQGA